MLGCVSHAAMGLWTQCCIARQLIRRVALGLDVVVCEQRRAYRIKYPQLGEGSEKWMLHVAKDLQLADYEPAPLSADYTARLREQAAMLVSRGCHTYQLVEAPEVLALKAEEVDERVARLKVAGCRDVSASLILLAKETDIRRLRYNISHYRQHRCAGACSIADFWREKLACGSVQATLDLVECNARLARTPVRTSAAKVDILLAAGASLDDIRAHSHVLKNRTLSTLRQRCAELMATDEAGHKKPLPVAWIAQSERVYREIVHNQRLAAVAEQSKQDYLWKEFSGAANTKPIWKDISYIKRQQLRVLQPKLEFLQSKGFSCSDILTTPYVLKLGVHSLRAVYAQLEAHAIEDVSLRLICSFYERRVVCSRRLPRRILPRVLECSATEIERVPPDLSEMFLQTSSVLLANCHFLVTECQIPRSCICRLPVILGHAHSRLRQHWALLHSDADLHSLALAWRADPWRLLNLLQYSIERELNFKHPVALCEEEEEEQEEDNGRPVDVRREIDSHDDDGDNFVLDCNATVNAQAMNDFDSDIQVDDGMGPQYTVV